MCVCVLACVCVCACVCGWVGAGRQAQVHLLVCLCVTKVHLHLCKPSYALVAPPPTCSLPFLLPDSSVNSPFSCTLPSFARPAPYHLRAPSPFHTFPPIFSCQTPPLSISTFSILSCQTPPLSISTFSILSCQTPPFASPLSPYFLVKPLPLHQAGPTAPVRAPSSPAGRTVKSPCLLHPTLSIHRLQNCVRASR